MGFLWFGHNGARLRRIENKLNLLLQEELRMSDQLKAVLAELDLLVVVVDEMVAVLGNMPPDDRAGEEQVLATLQSVRAKIEAALPPVA